MLRERQRQPLTRGTSPRAELRYPPRHREALAARGPLHKLTMGQWVRNYAFDQNELRRLYLLQPHAGAPGTAQQTLQKSIALSPLDKNTEVLLTGQNTQPRVIMNIGLTFGEDL